ncbi:hypothetical protein CV093_14815 [Oceanobacillus sp. 143]|nr:hypothetical protein CV093_14815 [Oceanobacillus sp. 143]
MKKLLWILIVIVFILSGTLIYVLVNDSKETAEVSGENTNTTIEQSIPVATTESYQFQDIESMEKSTSVKDAFERIFGKDRLFNDFVTDNKSYNGEIKYILNGVYKLDSIPNNDWSKYYPEKIYL